MIKDSIEKKAMEVLSAYGTSSAPVLIESVAQRYGAVIARNHFSGTESGFALRQGVRKIIGVNTATSPRRQRFTVAHELGHLVLHDTEKLIVDHSVFVAKRDQVSSMGTDAQEVEANQFAAAILMPNNLVVTELKKILTKGDFQSRDELIARMARGFDVSIEAMGYRLINLNIISA